MSKKTANICYADGKTRLSQNQGSGAWTNIKSKLIAKKFFVFRLLTVNMEIMILCRCVCILNILKRCLSLESEHYYPGGEKSK